MSGQKVDAGFFDLLLAQTKRVNERIERQEQMEDEVSDLPKELSFESHYKHLKRKQLEAVKQSWRREAGFFMKGKYPKPIKARYD